MRTSKGSTQDFKLTDGFEISYTSVGDKSNPLLLLVVGSSGIGSLYSRIAKELSPHFRCVYYDKRGFLLIASELEWAAKQRHEMVSVEKQADDAAELIKHLSPTSPAFVFGTFCGATETLDLTIRYPELVHTAILHEPITFSVIRDDRLRTEMLDLYSQVGKAEDTVEGHVTFRNYMFNPPRDANVTSTPAALPPPPRNVIELFNSRGGQSEAMAVLDYTLDEQMANAVSDKFIVIAGRDSAHMRVSRPGATLAYMLGDKIALWVLPGWHMSFASKSIAKPFCEELLSILRRTGRASFLPAKL